MKRSTLIFILILFAGVLTADSISSFRSLSTGGILPDNLDLAMDPIELNYLSGTNVFTNLSNLSRNDHLFANDARNHLMLGVSSDKFLSQKLKLALIYDFYDKEYPDLVTIGSIMGNTYDGLGLLEREELLYQDHDNDGIFDSYMFAEQMAENTESESGNDLRMILGFDISESLKTGLKLRFTQYDRESTEGSDGSHSYRNYITSGYLLEDGLTLDAPYTTTTEIGKFGSKIKQDDVFAEFAAAKSFARSDLRASIFVQKISSELKRIEHTELIIWRDEPIYLPFCNLDSETFQISNDGYASGLGLAYRKQLTRAAERKDEGFIKIQGRIDLLNLDAIIREESTSIDSSSTHPYMPDLERNEVRYLTEEDNDVSGYDFSGSVSMVQPLNRRTYFGIGMQLSHQQITEEGKHTFSFFYEDYEANYQAETWNIFRQTHLKVRDTDHKYVNTELRVPTGIEHWFSDAKRFAIRFGSVFTQTSETRKNRYIPSDIQRICDMTYNSTMDEPEYYYHPDYESHVTDIETVTQKSSRTQFSYGLGFRPSKNMQIDLMGFFDYPCTELLTTDFFRNLRLSFSIRL